MPIILHIGNLHDQPISVGGKASNLLKLSQFGVKVPKWLVIPNTYFEAQISKDGIDKISTKLIKEIETYFGSTSKDRSYAVRSSGAQEDGSQHSFAGQFKTNLYVPFSKLGESILDVYYSANSEHIQAYRKENNLAHHAEMNVIVQEMIPSEVAGVGFGINPVSGDPFTKVISSVFGLGEGLVSGKLDADTYYVSPSGIKSKLLTKTHQFIQSPEGFGVIKSDVSEHLQSTSSLTNEQLLEISKVLDLLQQKLNSPQDIEFAYFNNELFLLQTRPITTVNNSTGEYTLWDNSNIIESYPGITTPLTYSFILKMYEMVYKQFVGLLGVSQAEIQQHSIIFENTLGLVRGRVYYNLLHWYKMLAMVPGYSINAEFMEQMMGVKERFVLQEKFGMNKGLAWWRSIKMIVNLIRLFSSLKKERNRFQKQLNQIISTYKAIDFKALPPKEIVQHYLEFEESLLLKWRAPLINDFFAMIWFGLLRKQTEKHFPDLSNIHNDLLCGNDDIISVEPIHQCIAISNLISGESKFKDLFLNQSSHQIWEAIKKKEFEEIRIAIESYIDQFGERCVGELKLETVSYSQNPLLFVQVIQSYVKQGITVKKQSSKLEKDIRNEAEKEVSAKFKEKRLANWWFNYVLRQARDLISNRENLRYERTRGFGMVRNMFSALGEKLELEGKITNATDVFYLELEEIKTLAKGNWNPEFEGRIAERKLEFEAYRKQEPPQERFFTFGNDFSDERIYSTEKLEILDGKLQGIGCCPGRVKGKVRVVLDPKELDSLDGDILVTSSTDPGWVTLLPTASAIIVERGSLLSHSAIVSREMGIPCIVSVTGLLRTLKTGDIVEMNGSTGIITLIE